MTQANYFPITYRLYCRIITLVTELVFELIHCIKPLPPRGQTELMDFKMIFGVLICTGLYWLKQKQKMTPLFSSPHRAKVLSDSLVVSHNLAEPVDFLASVSLALEPVRSKVLYDVSGDLLLMKVCHALSKR